MPIHFVEVLQSELKRGELVLEDHAQATTQYHDSQAWQQVDRSMSGELGAAWHMPAGSRINPN